MGLVAGILTGYDSRSYAIFCQNYSVMQKKTVNGKVLAQLHTLDLLDSCIVAF